MTDSYSNLSPSHLHLRHRRKRHIPALFDPAASERRTHVSLATRAPQAVPRAGSERRLAVGIGLRMLKLSAIVLAAGQGTRMKSPTPKMLHPLAGRPLIYYSVRAVLDAGASDVVVVVGHGADQVGGELP